MIEYESFPGSEGHQEETYHEPQVDHINQVLENGVTWQARTEEIFDKSESQRKDSCYKAGCKYTPQQVDEVQYIITLYLELVIVEYSQDEEVEDDPGKPKGYIGFYVVDRAEKDGDVCKYQSQPGYYAHGK